MDTLPLNGNHGNSYSLASAEYMSDCVQIIDRGGYGGHKETTLEKKILKELTSNYIPTYLNNHNHATHTHDRAGSEHGRNLMNKLVNNVSNGGKDALGLSGLSGLSGLGLGVGGGVGVGVSGGVLDVGDSAAYNHDDGSVSGGGGGGGGLELIREESHAPLLPPRVTPTDSHTLHHLHHLQQQQLLHQHQHHHLHPHPFSSTSGSCTGRRLPQENSESFFPLLGGEQTQVDTPSPQRDSLYTSMPELADADSDAAGGKEPLGGGDGSGSGSGKGVAGGDALDDVYYKSMPNLGSRNHLHQLSSYYQLGRGSSDGFIVPPNKEDPSPEDPPPPEASHLVTSL